ncbi:hypothetical protein PR202_gb07677 [Eleusine coracana subsp. coracana]|uniref:Reverse transcriptase zinc-binding domain-containing protein n=1 Tax=Eleusine coracana subsp. coracana TaxID=191504 RepID=A0AAV5ECV1_ELECO|nr:hypothetical protein PR202_gb07677 [Eleusine coracana subsp. coracana]
MQTTIGNGRTNLFWKEKWIHGSSIAELAPTVIAAVPAKTWDTRLVAEALVNQNWAHDIEGGISMIGLYELFQLADILADVVLSEEEDLHIWRFDNSGQYTTKSTYLAFFNGAIQFEPWRRIWKSWAPAKCKIFLWLAVRNNVGQQIVWQKETSLILTIAYCVTKKLKISNIFLPRVYLPGSFGFGFYHCSLAALCSPSAHCLLHRVMEKECEKGREGETKRF